MDVGNVKNISNWDKQKMNSCALYCSAAYVIFWLCNVAHILWIYLCLQQVKNQEKVRIAVIIVGRQLFWMIMTTHYRHALSVRKRNIRHDEDFYCSRFFIVFSWYGFCSFWRHRCKWLSCWKQALSLSLNDNGLLSSVIFKYMLCII